MHDPTPLSPAEVLRATADYFEADPTRWGRGFYWEPATGCRCALGGIAIVLDETNPHSDPFVLPKDGAYAAGRGAIDALEGYLRTQLGISLPDDPALELVGEWNDAPGRTVHEVIGTLRAAARWAETPVPA